MLSLHGFISAGEEASRPKLRAGTGNWRAWGGRSVSTVGTHKYMRAPFIVDSDGDTLSPQPLASILSIVPVLARKEYEPTSDWFFSALWPANERDSFVSWVGPISAPFRRNSWRQFFSVGHMTSQHAKLRVPCWSKHMKL